MWGKLVVISLCIPSKVAAPIWKTIPCSASIYEAFVCQFVAIAKATYAENVQTALLCLVQIKSVHVLNSCGLWFPSMMYAHDRLLHHVGMSSFYVWYTYGPLLHSLRISGFYEVCLYIRSSRAFPLNYQLLIMRYVYGESVSGTKLCTNNKVCTHKKCFVHQK